MEPQTERSETARQRARAPVAAAVPTEVDHER